MLLFIGHSHIEAIRTALQDRPRAGIRAVNLRRSSEHSILGDDEPRTLCVCMGGNAHNLLGLFEHPQPFAVGDHSKVANAIEGRMFIPHAVIYETLAHILKSATDEMEAVFNRYPTAGRYCLNAPPPVGDQTHILEYPGIFRDKIELGIGPRWLRKALYNVQTDVFQAASSSCGAAFITAPEEVLDDEGFLKREYCSKDPTHGNSLYGQAVLSKFLSKTEVAL